MFLMEVDDRLSGLEHVRVVFNLGRVIEIQFEANSGVISEVHGVPG